MTSWGMPETRKELERDRWQFALIGAFSALLVAVCSVPHDPGLTRAFIGATVANIALWIYRKRRGDFRTKTNHQGDGTDSNAAPIID